MSRKRMIYAKAVFAVMALGILSRRYPDCLPSFLGKYPGDALWALMIFFGVRFLQPRSSVLFAACAAFGFSCAVEFAKLYHAPWIESVRATNTGQLVLGHVFSWKNLAAYAIGILFGGFMELAIAWCRTKQKPLIKPPDHT